MADFNRSQLYPSDSRARVRAHITCPRCRVDPSHISRQYWEATRPPQQSIIPSVESAPSTVHRSIGYPDVCCLRESTSGSLRIPQTPVAISNVPPPPPPQQPQQQSIRSASSYYVSPPANVAPSTLNRQTDSHSSRSVGETWRIRGVFDSHMTPDVTRRTESNPGPLPDVTRHSAVTPTTVIHHSRGASAPVTSGFESADRSVSRYPPDSRHRPVTSSSFREVVHRSEVTPRAAAPNPQWKREHQCQTGTPWVTRCQQADNRPMQYNGNSASTNTANSPHVQAVTTTTTTNSSNSCWRPTPHHVLSQCPLPDLVTPRRQARKQCCGLLATHSVAVRWLVVVVASLGLLCSIVGTVLGGVVKAAGKEHLSIALLLIGLGIVLVSMSGIAWRLTSRDGAPSCRTMFGFRRARSEPHRRFVPRVPHYGRPHPFSAMLYPDIPLRPPPPSYQASMQEYRLRLLLMDRPQMPTPAPPPPQHPPPPPPPPPTYRGPATVYSRFPMSMGPSDYSRPPSYRSRPPSSAGQPSPLGPEDIDLASIDPHTNASAEEQQPSSSSTQTRSTQSNGNHVEVVAQV